MHKAIFTLLFLVLSVGGSHAQAENPLEGKTVAVYFSKKAFYFDRPYYHYLSQFVEKAEDEDILIDDLKLQFLVSMGTLFSNQLAQVSAADSSFFLNEQPDLARAFIDAYSTVEHKMLPLGVALEDVDLILVVNPFHLLTTRVPVVLTRSNRLVTKYDMIKSAKLNFELWEPSTGRLVQVTESCFKQGVNEAPTPVFDFKSEASKTGKFLELVFTDAVSRMETSADPNCPELVEGETN